MFLPVQFVLEESLLTTHLLAWCVLSLFLVVPGHTALDFITGLPPLQGNTVILTKKTLKHVVVFLAQLS